MKTKVEINGYEIEIEEMDGRIMVKATRENEEGEEEVVEEFTLEAEGGEEAPEGGEDVQGFEEFEGGEEEGDFGDDDLEEFEGGDEDEDEDEVKLESFQSFVNKRK